MNFKISLSMSATNKEARWASGKYCIESVDQFGEYWHLSNIKSSDP